MDIFGPQYSSIFSNFDLAISCILKTYAPLYLLSIYRFISAGYNDSFCIQPNTVCLHISHSNFPHVALSLASIILIIPFLSLKTLKRLILIKGLYYFSNLFTVRYSHCSSFHLCSYITYVFISDIDSFYFQMIRFLSSMSYSSLTLVHYLSAEILFLRLFWCCPFFHHP